LCTFDLPAGTPSPRERAFSASSDKENAMDLSTISRETLVDDLIALTPQPSTRSTEPGAPRASDAVASTRLEREQRVQQILAIAKELLMRELRRDCERAPMMSSPQALRDWLRLRCAGLEHEVFLVVYFNAHQRVLDAEALFRGTLTQTAVYPREIVKAALARNAAGVAFAHNHPSGSAEPSRADEMLTATLKAALALVDVRVVDHFVVAEDSVVSMAERGLL